MLGNLLDVRTVLLSGVIPVVILVLFHILTMSSNFDIVGHLDHAISEYE